MYRNSAAINAYSYDLPPELPSQKLIEYWCLLCCSTAAAAAVRHELCLIVCMMVSLSTPTKSRLCLGCAAIHHELFYMIVCMLVSLPGCAVQMPAIERRQYVVVVAHQSARCFAPIAAAAAAHSPRALLHVAPAPRATLLRHALSQQQLILCC